MQLCLVVPDLLWPEPADAALFGEQSPAGLSWLLGRSPCHRSPPLPREVALLACLGGETAQPIAHLRLLGERLPTPLAALPEHAGAHWCCADPVHLRFHQERIVLADAGAFSLSEDEALRLCHELNRQFAELGSFHVASPARWYLRLNAPLAADSMPLSAVAGRRLDGTLPGTTSPLSRIMNELQMVLHQHPLNAAREARGEPTINALWLWGSEVTALPEKRSSAPFSFLFADDPLALGLARAPGKASAAVPAGLADLLADDARGAAPLVLLDDLARHVPYEDNAAWQAALLRLESGWFAPAREHLGREISCIRLIAPTVYGLLEWQIKAGERWKFWRKPASLAALAQALAHSPVTSTGNPRTDD